MKYTIQRMVKTWYLVIALVILIICSFAIYKLKSNSKNQKIINVISQNKGTNDNNSENGVISKITAQAIDVTISASPSPVPSPSPSLINEHTGKLPLEVDKFNKLISTTYEGGITDKLTEYLAKNLDIYEATNTKVSANAVADVNHDGEKELILCYIYPYDKKIKESDYYFSRGKSSSSEIFLGVYTFKSGNLEELDKTKITEISDINITDLIPAFKDGIFVKSKYCDEYPFYEMYSIKENKLLKIDLKEFGLNTQAQFISVSRNSVTISHRITGGVYGGDDLKWSNGGFIPVSHNYVDNRLLFKTQLNKNWNGDISTLSKFDKTIPELKNGEVTVSNSYQLLWMIGSNRTIYLKAGIYDLRFANEVKNENVLIDSKKESFEIKNVNGLKIIGMGNDMVEIASRMQNSKVLKFSNSQSLEFKNLIMGHGIEFTGCTQEVLNLEECKNVKIDSCAFYGSGAYGITTKNVTNMNVINSTIEECSDGGVVLEDSSNLNFHNTNFYKNSGDILINVKNSSNIVFDGIKESGNTTKVFEKHENSEVDIRK